MNVFQFSSVNEIMIEGIFNENGYTKCSTFFGDLSIAEWYGANSIKDTYRNVTKSWIGDVKMFTEFVMCLNHKCWQYYQYATKGTNNLPKEIASVFNKLPLMEYSRLYEDLYYKARDLGYETYKGDELDYFYSTLD